MAWLILFSLVMSFFGVGVYTILLPMVGVTPAWIGGLIASVALVYILSQFVA